MGYQKTVEYGDYLEIFKYNEDAKGFSRKSRELQASRRNESFRNVGETELQQTESYKGKRADNAKRVSSAFRKLVIANLSESSSPIFVTLTYAENILQFGRAHQDLSSFFGALRYHFGKGIRYIAVPEFQRRGAIHFHALVWGLPPGMVKAERSSRMVARLWKQGFVDLIDTDGHEKLAGYMAKYMRKAFMDKRLFGKKAYVVSRNIIRPVIDKKPILWALDIKYGLSTLEPLQDRTFYTNWLGEGNYKLFNVNPSKQKND